MKTDGGLNETRAGIYSVNDKLPRWGQCVGVVTPYYQCRGSLDPRGEWHHMDGSVIENVQSWFLINPDEVEFGSPLPLPT
jgi:hypothetical protein